MVSRTALVSGASMLLAATAFAQPEWTQRAVTGPSTRSAHAMAFDPVRNQTVLFGGQRTTYFNDTWEFDGNTWSQKVGSPVLPVGRWGHSMVFDAARGHTLMFGGFTTVIPSPETWSWNGSQWTLLASTGPSGRYWCGMSYDSDRQVVVLFGGIRASRSAQTWEWNGTEWLLASTTGPTARYAPAMAYDSARHKTVLFGGNAGSGANAYMADTWEWDGAAWTLIPVSGPVGRYTHTMVYDDARQVCILHGGTPALNTYIGDTWEYNGSAWTQLPITTGLRNQHAMCYDSTRDATVLFGGIVADIYVDDTWELTGGNVPTCPADFNADGELNPDDLGDYITCYFSEPPCADADYNNDTETNPDDLGDFITAYFTGCD